MMVIEGYKSLTINSCPIEIDLWRYGRCYAEIEVNKLKKKVNLFRIRDDRPDRGENTVLLVFAKKHYQDLGFELNNDFKIKIKN